jgi:Spy/CpxP family protein refolding chaperone
MNRYRLLIIGASLLLSASAQPQQTTTCTNPPAKQVSGGEDAGLPTVEAQLNVLNQRLNLTEDQQNKIRPILKQLHETTEKLARDKNLSHEERLARVRPERYKADKQIREILSDDQKKKLDAYEQGPHPEMHGNLTGSAPPAHN